jgi:hypothetical protein
MAISYAAAEALKLKSSSNSVGDRVPKGVYKTIIRGAEVLSNLDEGTVKRSTFLKRLQQNRKTISAGKGNVSPLLGIEGPLIDMLLMLASMRQPLCPRSPQFNKFNGRN